MGATKNPKTLLTSQSLAATASVNATEWDMRTDYAGKLFVRLSLPGSAPTSAPVVTFYSGEATGIKRKLWQSAGTTTAADYPMDIACDYGLADMFANVTITNGATNSITVEVYGQEASGL